jgi:tetratricopeptide (TPR) repeat protein
MNSCTLEVKKTEEGMATASQVSKIQGIITSRFFRYFLFTTLISHIFWYFFDFTWPYYWNIFASLLFSFGMCLLSSKSSDEVTNCLCGLGREDISQQDWLYGEMNKIRSLKKQRNFDKAFALVNALLAEAPNFPEALYLKAHLLWEGFKNPWAAEKCFRRVIELTKDDQPVHRWASSCLSCIYSKVSS